MSQTPAAPPQYSPDGKQFWDGARWIPLTRKGYGVGCMLAVTLAALILGTVCGVAASGARSSTSGSTDAAQAHTYATTAEPHLSSIETTSSKMGTDCGAANASKCKADAAAESAEAKSLLTDLSKLPVPSCLSAANQELVTATELLVDGSDEAVAGINANNTPKIEYAAQLVELASKHLTKATDDLNAASCGS